MTALKTDVYLRPETLDEALELLNKHGPAAKPIAGGTDVIVMAKRKKINPAILVSLRRLDELRYIKEENGRIHIGGLTTLRELEKSELIADLFPALADAVNKMASVQIRNVATMAGNIATAAPSADTAPPLLISGADVRLVSKEGLRLAPLNTFFVGPGESIIKPGELISEIIIPIPASPYGQAFWKHSRRKAMDLAIVSTAVHLELEEDLETCRLARIGLGVAAPTPIRTPQAEAKLVGQKITSELLKNIGDVSCDESACRDSLRGETWYRQEIIKVMVRRMGLLALERARLKFGIKSD